MKRLAWWLSGTALILGCLHRVHFRPVSLKVWLAGAAKVLAESLSPTLVLAGILGSLLAAFRRSPLAALAGIAGAWMSAEYIRGVANAPSGLADAFSEGWRARIPPEAEAGMLPRRWQFVTPAPPLALRTNNVTFAVVSLPPAGPQGDRPILCDIWQPPRGVAPSGLGLIYLHGSAWYLGDKDIGTRTFFGHLAGQGHVVMDVAYRMCPETDFRGMTNDAKRAIAWLKMHGAEYGVDPARIVISGGSAGAHLALLAAFTPTVDALCPPDLAGEDLSVRAVVAFYGPADFASIEDYHRWRRLDNPLEGCEGPLVPPGKDASFRERRAYDRLQVRRLRNLALDMFGGYPETVPDAYRLGSPASHVGPDCPPTLLIHGDHDMLVPVSSTRALAAALRACDVPVDYLELPASEHGFDLALPRLAPAAQVATWEVERFLALV